MSMKGLLEVLIHIESFRNIDLFYQGVYNLEVKLYQKTPEPLKKRAKTVNYAHQKEDRIEVAKPYLNYMSHSQEAKLQTAKEYSIRD